MQSLNVKMIIASTSVAHCVEPHCASSSFYVETFFTVSSHLGRNGEGRGGSGEGARGGEACLSGFATHVHRTERFRPGLTKRGKP